MASLVIAITTTASCGSNNDILPDSPNTPVTPQPVENNDISVRNLTRATILFDAAMQHYISGEMKMADMYNPSTDKPSGEADVWPYTAAIEACNSILEGYSSLTKAGKKPEQGTASEYKAQLEKLYDGLEYYAGTFKLTSYTLNNQ